MSPGFKWNMYLLQKLCVSGSNPSLLRQNFKNSFCHKCGSFPPFELLELLVNSSLMFFHGEYFQQIFGLILGTYVAPILTNSYMAMLGAGLKLKCMSDPKLIWPVLFKRFIDDSVEQVYTKILFIGLKN